MGIVKVGTGAEVTGPQAVTHAVIDVGSNTIHLLVGRVEDGAVLPVTNEKISVRLGAGVDETGRIEEERLGIAAGTIKLFSSLAALNGARHVAVLATSAVRDAGNGHVLVEEVRRGMGLDMRLVSGREEAALGFRGAVSALGPGSLLGAPALVVDLGGGSAQLTLGDPSGELVERVSLPLGTNRTTERYARHDPPEYEELAAVREAALGALPGWNLPEGAAVVAIGGSARALLRLTRDELTVERLEKLAVQVSGRPSAALAREEGIAPERARVLPAAIATLAAVLEHYGAPSLAVVRGGVREGVILKMAEGALPEAETTIQVGGS